LSIRAESFDLLFRLSLKNVQKSVVFFDPQVRRPVVLCLEIALNKTHAGEPNRDSAHSPEAWSEDSVYDSHSIGPELLGPLALSNSRHFYGHAP
jgi:hypothetical protein